MIVVKICGKFYWVGEYVILELGQLVLIKVIFIYMRGEIVFFIYYCIYLDMFDFVVDLILNFDYSLI